MSHVCERSARDAGHPQPRRERGVRRVGSQRKRLGGGGLTPFFFLTEGRLQRKEDNIDRIGGFGGIGGIGELRVLRENKKEKNKWTLLKESTILRVHINKEKDYERIRQLENKLSRMLRSNL